MHNMKTNKFLIPVLFSASLFMISCSGGSDQSSETETTEEATDSTMASFTVDVPSSAVMWRGEMLGLYSHEGTLNFSEANVDVVNGEIAGGSFVVDLRSMTPTDENYKPEEGSTPEKLVGHLSSADFFAVDSFPTATFVIESVEGNTATGTLEVRGVKNQETVNNITFLDEEGTKMLRGTLTFNRKNYDVAFDMPVADKVLSDDIQLDIKLVASK